MSTNEKIRNLEGNRERGDWYKNEPTRYAENSLDNGRVVMGDPQEKESEKKDIRKDSNSQGLSHKQKSEQERKDQKGFDSTEGDDEKQNKENLEKTPVYDENGKKL